jgi:error-prone DNA polymerase
MEETNIPGRFAVRLGMRVVKGLPINDAARIVLARADQPF